MVLMFQNNTRKIPSFKKVPFYFFFHNFLQKDVRNIPIIFCFETFTQEFIKILMKKIKWDFTGIFL